VRALWVKAPFVLRRHPALLSAVVFAAALSAFAAASSPLVRAGVESESLQGQLRNMTPLAAGLEIRVPEGDTKGDRMRRAAAVRFGRRVRSLGPPVVSSLLPAQIAGRVGAGVEVVALARTGAVSHVQHETRSAGAGVWIADTTAAAAHLHAGSTLRLTEHVFFERATVVKLRVAGIYRSLERDTSNPYWANWLQDIRSPYPDAPAPPQFVLMPLAAFERTAAALATSVENRYEFPVDPRALTVTSAKQLSRRVGSLAAEIERGARPVQPLGCIPQRCTTSSTLSSARAIASSEVAAVAPTVSLLSACGVLIALAIGVSIGIALLRRRVDEARALFARGEAPRSFAARVVLEGLLPGIAGLAVGLGGSLLALRALAPAGATEDTTDGAVRALLATAAALAAVAAGAAAAYPRLSGPTSLAGWARRVPWEIAPLGVAAVLLGILLGGRGLARDAAGATHPRLAVFVLPLVAVPGVAGLAARVARHLIRGRGRAAPVPVYLAVRRLTGARGLLLVVVVAAATAFGTFAYASTLSASLSRSTAEKAWVANGSDVQGIVDVHATAAPAGFPFPVAVVQVDTANVAFSSGARVDLIAGDPAQLARTLRWGGGRSDDPRRLLRRLSGQAGSALPAIATPGAPEERTIVDQGARLPIRIVGHAAVPGATADRPALLVPRSVLRRLARRAQILDPAPQATGLVWAKGAPRIVERALAKSQLAPVFMTTPAHILENASVKAAARSYRFVRVIGIAAATLSVLSLLLYLQARRRSQLIATAIARRMGLGVFADAAALSAEAGVIVLFGGVIGAAAAIATAEPVARHVDSLPQYAPGPAFTVPWSLLAAGLAAALVVTAILAAATTILARRADVAGALRVV
jgi:putative ABC transport system permease protein